MSNSNRSKCTFTDCPLYRNQWTVRFGGNLESKVVLLGESPGLQEEEENYLYRGNAGDLSRECAKIAGFPWQNLILATVARCRIDRKTMNDREQKAVLKACRPHITRFLKKVKPKLILSMGDYPLQSILKMSGITKKTNKWYWSTEFNCWILTCYSPLYILGHGNFKGALVNAFRQLQAAILNRYEPPVATGGVYREVSSIEHLIEAKGTISVDTEGQGLDWSNPNYIVISVQFSNKVGTGDVLFLYEECKKGEEDIVIKWSRGTKIPLKTKKDKFRTVMADVDVYVRKCEGFDRKLKELAEILADKKIKKYMMNGNFDIHVLDTLFKREWGKELVINNYAMDLQAAAHMLNEVIYTMASLETLQRDFAVNKEEYNSLFAKEYGKNDMLAVPRDAIIEYGGADADVTLQVGLGLRKELLKKGRERQLNYFVKFVMPALQSLAMLETEGSWIDMEAMPQVMSEVHHLMMQHQAKALQVIPDAVKDYKDHKQKNKVKIKKDGIVLKRVDFISDILFSEYGFRCRVMRKTKSGKVSSDKHVRSELLDGRLSKNARIFLENYNEFSEYHTLWSRYLHGFEKHVKPHDGRIHSSLSMTTAVTGRVASSKPNVMNSPKRSEKAKFVRKLISAPPGWLLFAADQNQSELRWLAHVAREPEMIKIFNDDSLDVHTETAKEMIAGNWEDLSDAEKKTARRNAKAVNFGLIFGMSVNGFIIYGKQEYGVILSRSQAQAWFDAFFGKYNRVLPYHEETIEFCRKYKYVESPLGRRRHLPEILSDDKFLRMDAERQAINQRIQSPSSDTVLLALNEIKRKEIPHPDYCRASLFIHDELVFELKDCSKLHDYAAMIIHEMENPPLEKNFGVRLAVPLRAGGALGKNLSEMKDFEV